jgi:hypothetical protein
VKLGRLFAANDVDDGLVDWVKGLLDEKEGHSG